MIFVFHPTHHQVAKSSQNHQTLLCTNHAKINSFCPQTFPTSLWRHLRGLSPPSFQKPSFSFFTPHTTKSQYQAKTPNLVMHQPCQDQFLLLPKFSHVTLEAIVRFESRHFSKTMIFVFHPTHHQVTKSNQNHQTLLCTNHAKINSFCPQTFPTSLWMHL